jgi:methionyl aminopeptidase
VIERKSSREIAKQTQAGMIVAETLELLADAARPGVTTGELDRIAERHIKRRGGVATFKGYRGFPGSICASPNDMIVHGIPGRYELADGDILSLDVGVTYRGFVGDSAVTVAVGNVPEDDAAPAGGVSGGPAPDDRPVPRRQPAARPRRRLPGVCRGRRRLRRRAPAGRPRRRSAACTRIRRSRTTVSRHRAGAAGGDGVRDRADDHGRVARHPLDDDGWSIYTVDGSMAAHFEHTVAVTADGPLILTLGPDGTSIVDRPV